MKLTITTLLDNKKVISVKKVKGDKKILGYINEVLRLNAILYTKNIKNTISILNKDNLTIIYDFENVNAIYFIPDVED